MSVRHVKALLDAPPQLAPDGLAPVHMGKFTFTPAGLSVEGTPSFEEWAEAMGVLAVLERGLAFVAGDLMIFGEREFGERAAQIIDARSWSASTVKVYTWLARSVPPQNRMLDRGLTIAHHLAVAALEPPAQAKWLKQACADPEPWSVGQLKAAVKHGSVQDETAWLIVVTCPSAAKQEKLQKQLELDGYACKAVTKRGA